VQTLLIINSHKDTLDKPETLQYAPMFEPNKKFDGFDVRVQARSTKHIKHKGSRSKVIP